MNVTEVLSKELFTPIDERLLAQFQAARIGRTKKRFHFICVSIKANNLVSLCEVKKDKDGYKKRSEWMLDELSRIAGASSDEVHFTFNDKIYKFQSATIRERDEFVENLYTIIKRYHKNNVIPIDNLEHVLKSVIEQELLTQTLKEQQSSEMDLRTGSNSNLLRTYSSQETTKDRAKGRAHSDLKVEIFVQNNRIFLKIFERILSGLWRNLPKTGEFFTTFQPVIELI